MSYLSVLFGSGQGNQANPYMWVLVGIVLFIQFLPYLAILFSRKIGSKMLWLMLFISVTLLSWGITFSLSLIKSDFIATAILLFPNYFLYAIASSYSTQKQQ